MVLVVLLFLLMLLVVWRLSISPEPPPLTPASPRLEVRTHHPPPAVPPAEEELKMDHPTIREVLKAHGVKQLYHFTDRANLASIERHGGLYSWHFCFENGIPIARIGSDELSRSLDRRMGLHDFVRLSFNPTHPMMYVALREGRIEDPYLLEIDPEVLILRSTLYSDVNATKYGARRGGECHHLRNIRFDICRGQTRYYHLPNDLKPYYQAEAMVQTFIPIDLVLTIRRATR